MAEEWREIPDCGEYEASNLGRIRSVRARFNKRAWFTRTGGIMALRVDRYGYHSVKLSVGNLKQSYAVHRLVLSAFAGPQPDGMQACHNNGLKTDNRPENLRWDTVKANHHDKKKHGTDLIGERNPNARLTRDQACVIRSSPESHLTLAKVFGVSTSLICEIKQGRCWKDAA